MTLYFFDLLFQPGVFLQAYLLVITPQVHKSIVGPGQTRPAVCGNHGSIAGNGKVICRTGKRKNEESAENSALSSVVIRIGKSSNQLREDLKKLYNLKLVILSTLNSKMSQLSHHTLQNRVTRKQIIEGKPVANAGP